MNDSFTYLIGVAFDAKIGILFTNDLSPLTPSSANVKNRLVILNNNWHNKKELTFQLAHEISHIINGDSGVLYYTTAVNHSKIESDANITAISLLVPYYFDELDYSVASIDNFMNAYQIPSTLREKCESEIRKYYSSRDTAFY